MESEMSINEQHADMSRYQEVGWIKNQIIGFKEPYLRKILSGEKLSDYESAYLEALEKVEKMVQDRQNELAESDE